MLKMITVTSSLQISSLKPWPTFLKTIKPSLISISTSKLSLSFSLPIAGLIRTALFCLFFFWVSVPIHFKSQCNLNSWVNSSSGPVWKGDLEETYTFPGCGWSWCLGMPPHMRTYKPAEDLNSCPKTLQFSLQTRSASLQTRYYLPVMKHYRSYCHLKHKWYDSSRRISFPQVWNNHENEQTVQHYTLEHILYRYMQRGFLANGQQAHYLQLMAQKEIFFQNYFHIARKAN